MRAQIEQRKAALQRQGQELDRRLVEIDRQGQQLQQERSQIIANLNAVSGALQLCEDLLRTTADSGQRTIDRGGDDAGAVEGKDRGTGEGDAAHRVRLNLS